MSKEYINDVLSENEILVTIAEIYDISALPFQNQNSEMIDVDNIVHVSNKSTLLDNSIELHDILKDFYKTEIVTMTNL